MYFALFKVISLCGAANAIPRAQGMIVITNGPVGGQGGESHETRDDIASAERQ
jgi:hypothetical protein